MDKVKTAVEQLVEEMKAGKVYEDYCTQLQKVKEVNGLKEKIDEFRKENFALQSAGNPDLEAIEEFESKYEDLRENPLVSDFLEAELALCRMIQDINIYITEALNFE